MHRRPRSRWGRPPHPRHGRVLATLASRGALCALLGFPALAALSGCAVPVTGAEDEPVAVTRQRIMGGVEDATDTAVVDIIWHTGTDYYAECSGSLIAPNLVLTAHHCVSNVLNGSSGIDCSASSFDAPASVGLFDLSTYETLSSTPYGRYYGVLQILLPPNSTQTSFCGVDLVMMILANNVPDSEATPLVPRVDTQIAQHEPYSAVGFGTVDETSGAGTRRRLDGLTTHCVGTGCGPTTAGEIDPKHEFIGDHGVCHGDSGGPALDAQGRVVGVTSRGGANCSNPIYEDVYSWASWIEMGAMQAAKMGGYTAPPWATGYPTDPIYSDPIGGSCDASECPSNLCLQDAAGSYCTRLCETAAPCPAGYTCTTVTGAEVCQRPPPPPMPMRSSSASSSSGAPAPSGHSGCSVAAAPTEPVPWSLAALGLLALRRRPRWRSRSDG